MRSQSQWINRLATGVELVEWLRKTIDNFKDLLVGATPWDETLPAGRFSTLDRAREVFQRPNLSITIVPEPLELTRWRRDFRLWKAHQTRWRFHCDSSFRANMKRNYPETHARLAAEDRFFLGQPCGESPRPPQHPGR